MTTQTPTPSLSAVPSTLRIPLAARALGGQMFPEMAVDDKSAADALARMGDDGQQWLQDRRSIYGNLARTRCYRDGALDFLKAHPAGHVVNIGCGLANYWQWLDNGQMRMTDADLPEVMALRRQFMPSQDARHVLADADLTQADWWNHLDLPARRDETPVFIIIEGVLLYLMPDTVHAVLATFGERAPAGSVLMFDSMCWLFIGKAKHHPSVKRMDAEFHWGPRKLAELTAPHPRLRLLASHSVMGSYSLAFKITQSIFRAVTGVPFFAVYTLGVADA